MVGIIRKTKAFFGARYGASIFQPFWDFIKLMKKESKPNYHSIKQFGSLITLVGEKNTEIISEDLITIAKQSLSKKDCKITNNLSIINPRIVNNPGIYSLLNNKYFI